MRRFLSALLTGALALGFTLVAAGPADASITTPANNAVIAGNVTVTDSGAKNSGNFYCGDGNLRLKVTLVNSSNQVVATLINLSGSAAKGSESATLVTRNHPNGSYTLRSEVRNVVKSGWGGALCGTSTSNTSRAVAIRNTVNLTYAGALSAPRNTSVPVSATVVDANVSGVNVGGVTVNFSLSGGGGSTSAVTNGAGVATANLPVSGSARTATLTVSTPGNAFYQSKSITRSFDVTKNSTATTLTQPATVVHGQPISFTANVAATNGTGVPTGEVQFTVDDVAFGDPVDLNASGTATTPPSTSLSTGSHTVVATYSGDSGFLGSTSTQRTATVDKADTTTSLSASPSPTVSGQAVVFTARVDVVAPGAGTPVGGVQFIVDNQPYGTAVPLSGDTATLTISDLATGNHPVQATYNGNPDFRSSSSAELTHGVNKADSNLVLTTSNPDAVAREPLTYTATVTAVGPGSGTPTGTVQFYADGEPLGDAVALSGGTATSPVAKLTAGSHQITADYQGDANFAGANDDYTQQVVAAQTTTVVSSSPNPSVVGQPVTLSATVAPVAPSTGTPEGAVQFFVDGDQVAFANVVDGTASTSLTTLAVGSHAVTAKYLSGEISYLTSTSAAATHQVNKAATRTTLASSSPTSVYGQLVTFTADVSVLAPGAGAPSGTITFADGPTVLDTVPVDSGTNFQATYTTSGLSVGQHAITATYSGDASFLTSNASVGQTVQKAQTSTVVTSSNNPAMTGQGAQFTATVSAVAPGSGTPTGTVLFTVNGMPLGVVTLVDGVATSGSFASLTPGTYKVKAQYNGDGNFRTSSALLDQGMGQVVDQGATSMALTSGPDPAVHGDPVTVSATVSAVAPATGKPTGVVRFWEGGVLLGSVSLAPGTGSSSTAEFVTSTLAPGTHSIRAEYVGNFNFAGTEATVAQTVESIDTVTGIESSANPSAFGEDVTFTAVVAAPAGEPTGTVTFTEGDVVLGTATIATVDGRQVASITVEDLSVGTHPITAAYAGAGQFAASTSAEFIQVVERAVATIVAGEPEVNGEVTATLTGLGGEPLAGETVSFYSHPSDDQGVHLCDAVTDVDGVASCDETVINIVIGGSFDGGYDARFAGNDHYLPAEDYGRQF